MGNVKLDFSKKFSNQWTTFATIHMKAFKRTFRNGELMTKEQIENIIQENMQKIYLYCVKKLENTAVAEANEVGAIVSMWSMMEGMIELALDDGFVTKGNGQNLSAFYLKTEKE